MKIRSGHIVFFLLLIIHSSQTVEPNLHYFKERNRQCHYNCILRNNIFPFFLGWRSQRQVRKRKDFRKHTSSSTKIQHISSGCERLRFGHVAELRRALLANVTHAGTKRKSRCDADGRRSQRESAPVHKKRLRIL